MPSVQGSAGYMEMINSLQKGLAVNIQAGFRQLLENKHLYQSVHVDTSNSEALVNDFVKQFMAGNTDVPNGEALVRDSVKQFLVKSTSGGHPTTKQLIGVDGNDAYSVPWEAEDPSARGIVASSGGFFTGKPIAGHPSFPLTGVPFNVPSIKTVCSQCGERYPFNLLKATELIEGTFDNRELVRDQPIFQVFVMVYQCQSCRGLPETFLVRRLGTKLTLAGRGTMEIVLTPKVLPKKQSRFYSDAVIAYNSGQTLAGMFLLRTFIEQFVREKQGPDDEHVDRLLDAYAATLPDDFKGRFPSLKSIYAKLSDAIHRAEACENLFNECCSEIEHHFRARDVYRIP